MDLPIVYSEQYPNGLGSTIKSLKEKLLDIKSTRIEDHFSCFANNNKILLEKNLIKVNKLYCVELRRIFVFYKQQLI